MKQLIEFPVENGETVIVEVTMPQGAGGVERAARPGEVAARAKLTFEEALDKVKPATQAIITTLHSLSERPSEIAVEFGIKLNAEAGAFIASTGVEANYKVTLTWKRA